MERQLINYLPFILRDLPAFKAAMASQQPEFSALWDSVAAFQDDLFILTAGDRGLARWEYILDLVPKASDSFDVRRIRILTALNRQLPYTLPQLQNVLNNIYGVGASTAEVPENSYTLRVTMPYTDTYADTMELVDAMSPQNLFCSTSRIWKMHILQPTPPLPHAAQSPPAPSASRASSGRRKSPVGHMQSVQPAAPGCRPPWLCPASSARKRSVRRPLQAAGWPTPARPSPSRLEE